MLGKSSYKDSRFPSTSSGKVKGMLVMSPIKENLISEIIRVSQRNLLGKNNDLGATHSDGHERGCVEWVQKNAAIYRKHFHNRLGGCSCQELGDILKELSESQKDLNEILKDCSKFPASNPPTQLS